MTVVVLSLLVLSFACAVISSHPRPLVIWHGMGDSHASPGMLEFQEAIKEIHPDIFIHSVYIDEDLEADRKACFVRSLTSHPC
jgi:palmitoyl-protein thioesterase